MNEPLEPAAPAAPAAPATTPAQPAAAHTRRWLAGLGRLKRPVLAVAAVGAVLSGLLGWWNTYRTVREVATAPAAQPAPAALAGLSIVVLPFANQTGNPQQAHIADGLTVSITADLVRLRDVFIVPVSSAAAYRDRPAPVRQVGRELGVRFVLQGSVMASGDKLRVHAQLADASTGAQNWAETFEGELGDLFALQDRITARIGNSVGLQLVMQLARESQARTGSAEAGDLLLRAFALSMQPASPQAYLERESLLRRALAKDPRNHAAQVHLARSVLLQALNFGDRMPADRREQLTAEGGALAASAAASGADDPWVSSALGLHAQLRGDLPAAVRHTERQLALDPRNPVPYNNLASLHLELVQAEPAVALLDKALALYPRGNDAIFANLALAHFMRGDAAAAAGWAQKAVDADTSNTEPYALLAMAAAELGDRPRAAAAAAAALRKFPQLKAPAAQGQACRSPAWCEFVRLRYLPAWREAGLPG